MKTTNKEKFMALVSNEKTDTVERNRERIKNRARLIESQQIALKVLIKLDELGWSQRELAKKMDVSPQQITKIVKGSENLTLETQVKLQEVLDIPILATYYDSKIEKMWSAVKFENSKEYTVPNHNSSSYENSPPDKQEVRMQSNLTLTQQIFTHLI